MTQTLRIHPGWVRLAKSLVPFADAATRELPLRRILRLSLFQVSVGMAVVLLYGTLNRVMIIELGMSAGLVAAMVALPLLFAPFRALIGHRSDEHLSVLGWRRVPYIWIGTLMQFGGLAIMPFALLVLAGRGEAADAPAWIGHSAAALAFLLVGAGMHTVQTAGLALATDLSSAEQRPRVVALLYVMLLLGTIVSALLFSLLLTDFREVRLVQLIQGTAVAAALLNGIALWRQEPRDPELAARAARRYAARKQGLAVAPEDDATESFRDAWRSLMAGGRAGRLLFAVGLGTAAFSMQDILLEPYGGAVLGLSVSATTLLTALLATGSLIAFLLSARRLSAGADPHRLAAEGALVGIAAFAAVLFAAPLEQPWLFRAGTLLIGFGGGAFSVGTLIAAMQLADGGRSGLALGAWGSVQATAAGGAIALGGALRDLVSGLGARGALGPVFTDPAAGYNVVYLVEIGLLFATLAAVGPLVRHTGVEGTKIGLADLPG